MKDLNVLNKTSWRDSTRNMLMNRPASLKLETIANELDVSPQWLRLFLRGKIENPGVMTIQALYSFLYTYNVELKEAKKRA